MLLRSILDKKTHVIVRHMMQKTSLKLSGSQSFKYIGSFIDFNRLGQLKIVNTTTVAILKRDLTSLKRKMDVRLQIWCKS